MSREIIPPKKITVVTSSPYYPRMEIETTRPAFRAPKKSRTELEEEKQEQSQTNNENNERAK